VLTLAIDCSARFCSAALYEEDADRILASASPDIGRGHAEQLPFVVQSVFDAAGVELPAVTRVGVSIGPGSFAGIRVGVAFARGLALALNVPAIGVGSLEAIAIPAARRHGRPVMAVLDARRDCVWVMLAGVDGGIRAPAAELTPQAAVALALEMKCALSGNGAALLAGLEPALAPHVLSDLAAPLIEDVARLAARLDPRTNPPEPRYLREADAKPQTGFALPHEVVV